MVTPRPRYSSRAPSAQRRRQDRVRPARRTRDAWAAQVRSASAKRAAQSAQSPGSGLPAGRVRARSRAATASRQAVDARAAGPRGRSGHGGRARSARRRQRVARVLALIASRAYPRTGGYNPARWTSPRSRRPWREQHLDGWLLYDFRGSNPIARSVIGFDESQIGTRRWFYLIPRAGRARRPSSTSSSPTPLKGAPGPGRPLPLLEGARGAPAEHLAGHEARRHGVQPGRRDPLRRRAWTPGPSRWCGPRAPRSSARPTSSSTSRPAGRRSRRRSTTAPRAGCLAAKDAGFALIRERLAARPARHARARSRRSSRARFAGARASRPIIPASSP